MTNCNFTDNRANYDGGAVWMNSGSVENCNFTDNKANFDGGALYMYSGSVENCNFTNNTASRYGGAVYFLDNGEVTNCNLPSITSLKMLDFAVMFTVLLWVVSNEQIQQIEE